MKGLTINEAIEHVTINGLEFTLVASSNNGVEIIHHKLEKGYHWGLIPEDGWEALEYIQILKGSLSALNSDRDPYIVFKQGDFLSGNPVKDSVLFMALEDTEFLYVSSQPVFHVYSGVMKRLKDLVIEVEKKDNYTANHCYRISDYSLKIGKHLKLPVWELQILNFAAYLHDVGKICIPESILNKPGKLDSTEWELIKQHSTFGKEILIDTGIPILNQVGIVVEQHHERYDGKGYPLGLAGDEINLLASIITVVDSYDAMTVDRVYQKARSKEEAIEELIRCKGTMYHPMAVDAFLSILNQEESVT